MFPNQNQQRNGAHKDYEPEKTISLAANLVDRKTVVLVPGHFAGFKSLVFRYPMIVSVN